MIIHKELHEGWTIKNEMRWQIRCMWHHFKWYEITDYMTYLITWSKLWEIIPKEQRGYMNNCQYTLDFIKLNPIIKHIYRERDDE